MSCKQFASNAGTSEVFYLLGFHNWTNTRVFIGADSNDDLSLNHSFVNAGSVFNSVYISDKHSAWTETQPHFIILGPDPCGYIWISCRAAVKLVEISRGQSGGRLGSWNRGGQRWTDYNTLPLILLYVRANARLDFEPDWSSHSVAFPRTQGWWAGHPGRAIPKPLWGSSQPSPSQFCTKSQILHATVPSVSCSEPFPGGPF